MKVIVAVDSFKGSVSSLEAGMAVKKGVLQAISDAEVIVMPLADGGEGTVEALVCGMGGKIRRIEVNGPFMKKIYAEYGIIEESSTAIIEIAAAAGIMLVKEEEKNPLMATSYGVGEIIKDAILKGCKNFIIGIGGSVTNDGGVGMLQALGFEFLNKEGKNIEKGGKALADIYEIKTENAMEELFRCDFKIACDVENPLCGDFGASAVYGPQKGATRETIEVLDNALNHLAAETKKIKTKDFSVLPGAGAAGGIGFAFAAYLNGNLRPGIEIVLDEINIDEMLKNANVLVTGEGRIDRQTSMGKAPIGIAKRAKKAGAKVIAVAGCTSDDAFECNAQGIDGFFSVADKAMTLEEATDKETTKKNITKTVSQIFGLIKAYI